MECKVIRGDCLEFLKKFKNDPNFKHFALTFFDPPFNQGKEYAETRDDLPEKEYWKWMKEILQNIHDLTIEGGSIYFMQREKNAEQVLSSLRETGWTFQNLIIWKKLTSAVPSEYRLAKQYQIIVFSTKGEKPRIFNKIRNDPPLYIYQKYARENGAFLTDLWDDIRELTSGYFAGDEPLRKDDGERLHNQQSPIKLLLRILLSSSKPEDHVFDPFAGTGTTAIVAKQLSRQVTTIEIAETNFNAINKRLESVRAIDNIEQYCSDYVFTDNLDHIWGKEIKSQALKDFKPQVPVKALDPIKLRKFIRKKVIKELKNDINEFFVSFNNIDSKLKFKIDSHLKEFFKRAEDENEENDSNTSDHPNNNIMIEDIDKEDNKNIKNVSNSKVSTKKLEEFVIKK